MEVVLPFGARRLSRLAVVFADWGNKKFICERAPQRLRKPTKNIIIYISASFAYCIAAVEQKENVMKKIGFVNFYLSEKRACDYFDRIAEVGKSLSEAEQCEVAYAWAEQSVSPDGVTSEQWCEKRGVRLCGTIEELCEKSDYIIILSSKAADKHLCYAEKVFPFGKNTFIDSPLATDCETAEKIFELAQRYDTKFFSSSPLRFAREVKYTTDNMIAVTGGGDNFDEAIIHQVEAAIAIVGRGADHVRVEAGRDTETDKCGFGVKIHYPDNRMVTLIYAPILNYEILTDVKKLVIRAEIFDNLCIEILKFFAKGKLPFNPQETLEVVRITKKIIAGKSTQNVWIPIWDGGDNR